MPLNPSPIIIPLTALHYGAVRAIYEAGIAGGNATFATNIPDWVQWNNEHLPHSRFVALDDAGAIVAWAALSPVSSRCVYGGVAETSIYVATAQHSRGIGALLLQQLIKASEANGIWTLQAGIFPENIASLRLHESAGFRQVGFREKIGQINGVWRDTLLLERRSRLIGIATPDNTSTIPTILVLCTGNSCRSQIAEAYLRHFASTKALIYSAGIETHGLNPRAVATMLEDGIDISAYQSKLVSVYAHLSFNFILTVCDHAHEHCPYLPGHATRLHYNFPDPAKATGTEAEIADQFRKVRNLIKAYAQAFVKNNL